MNNKSFDEFAYCKYFRSIANNFKRLGDENLIKQNITFSQLRVLIFISKKEEKCAVQNEIEKEFQIRGSSVTSILNNMEKSGIIGRRPSEKDKRIKNVFLTEKGEKLNQDLKNYIKNLDKEFVRNFSSEEKETFQKLLIKALNNFEQVK